MGEVNKMDPSRNDVAKNAVYVNKEEALILNTIEILDDEKENILSEVLRCYVCLELPKGKQVKICEEGHHFCLTCHKKMKCCGICRGKLLEGRNFVVEQLVSKLGPILGNTKSDLPPMKFPKNLTRGSYHCLHRCQVKLPAFKMLSHLRANHSANLLDNVRSNPYSGRFSFRLNVHFLQDEKYIWSAHVSDIGLFTLELNFFGMDFFGCVRMLGDNTVSSLFRYQLVVEFPNAATESSLELSIKNCPVSAYSDDVESVRARGNALIIKENTFLNYINVGSVIGVFVSIWEKKERLESKEKSTLSRTCMPERYLHFENDRKTRRNRNRNMRRNRLKSLRNAMISDEVFTRLQERLSDLNLTQIN